MKNLYLLSTEQSSRLAYLTKKGKEVFCDLRLFDELMPNILDSDNQNIYITCSSEFEPRNYVLWEDKVYKYKEFMKMKTPVYTDFFYILLTTDQDLINDGVQEIDDEFLEWFVKNPNCEEVEVRDIRTIPALQLGSENGHLMYKIIIPGQESKEEKIEEAAKEFAKLMGYKDEIIFALEENAFIEGAKWQQDRSYGEEEVAELLDLLKRSISEINHIKFTYKDKGHCVKYISDCETTIEQFKKK